MSVSFCRLTNGIYRCRFPGKGPRLLDYAREPLWEALASLPDDPVPFPLDSVQVYTAGDRTVIRIPCDSEEMLFGFGLQFQSANQRGRVYHLRTDHYTGLDNGRAHAPCPMYVAERGYGIFLDCAGEVAAYAATAQRTDDRIKAPARNRNTDSAWSAVPNSGYVELSFVGDSADLYLFTGTRPLTAVQRYNLLCGGGCLPPRWGLGFWHRTHTLFTADQVLQEADEFAAHGMPLSVIGLEPGWQTAAYPCTYVWDGERFPDPAAFLQMLLERNIRVNLWTHAYVARESPLYPPLQELSGSHEVWCGLAPDLSLPEVQDIFKRWFRQAHVDAGASGYKLDECDGFDFYLWPDHATFPSGLDGKTMRQLYALLLQRMTDELFREADRRTYGLIRASNSGASAYPYVLYSDCYRFREFLRALTNASFLGQLWVPEVREADSAEEWVRRFQLVAVSPLAMLNAWYSSLKPWSFPEVTDCVRKALRLRQALIPTLYTAFYRYRTEGIPPMRSLHQDYALHDAGSLLGDEAEEGVFYPVRNLRAVDDQFLIGDCLMAAPMFPDRSSRPVILPEGKWYDFYDGHCVGGHTCLTVEAPLDRIPLFVRDGGLVVLEQDGVLEVRHYGTADGSTLLICDDDSSYGYERDLYRSIRLEVRGGQYTETCLHDGYPDTLPPRVLREMTQPCGE